MRVLEPSTYSRALSRSRPSNHSQVEESSRHHHNPKPSTHHTTPPSSPLPMPAALPPPSLHPRPVAA